MLSSIHPLGERGRNNRWWLTVSAFTVASTLTGAAVGAALGGAGSLLLGGVAASALLVATATAALIGGALDMARIDPPGLKRQVNETWIGHYRGWVYGGAFGAQLGAGLATYVVTWLVYATLLSEFLTANPASGALVGAVFGVGRSAALILAAFIDRPSRLSVFHRRMHQLGAGVHRSAASGAALLGLVLIGGALL